MTRTRKPSKKALAAAKIQHLSAVKAMKRIKRSGLHRGLGFEHLYSGWSTDVVEVLQDYARLHLAKRGGRG